MELIKHTINKLINWPVWAEALSAYPLLIIHEKPPAGVQEAGAEEHSGKEISPLSTTCLQPLCPLPSPPAAERSWVIDIPFVLLYDNCCIKYVSLTPNPRESQIGLQKIVKHLRQLNLHELI